MLATAAIVGMAALPLQSAQAWGWWPGSWGNNGWGGYPYNGGWGGYPYYGGGYPHYGGYGYSYYGGGYGHPYYGGGYGYPHGWDYPATPQQQSSSSDSQ